MKYSSVNLSIQLGDNYILFYFLVYDEVFYKVDNLDYITTDEYKDLFLEEANKLLAVSIKTIHADYSGIRPKLKFKGKMNDFIIKDY